MSAKVVQMPTTPKEPLERISSISILGESYDLARNGSHFHLVEHKEPDAYNRPVARQVPLAGWVNNDKVQALVDIIGDLHLQMSVNELAASTRISALEDELARAHTALQREAEPEAKSRRPIAIRESGQGGIGVGLPNLLEPKPESKSEPGEDEQ